jgi:hypothetical protein
MQRTPNMQRARLRSGLGRSAALSAAVLTAGSLLLATAPQAHAQSGGWSHYDVAAPKVITLEFETDLLAWDLCWSDHTESARQQVASAAIGQMTNPGQLHIIRMPGLPPFYQRTSSASIWRDLNGKVITSRSVLQNRANYHIDVEQALIDIAGRIREARPGAKLTFERFELQPLPGRPDAYAQLGEVQDFYYTDRTIYLNRVEHILGQALSSTFFRARVEFAVRNDRWLVFPNQTGDFSLASINSPAWPPSEFEPDILALWGGGDGSGGPHGPIEESLILTPGSGFAQG